MIRVPPYIGKPKMFFIEAEQEDQLLDISTLDLFGCPINSGVHLGPNRKTETDSNSMSYKVLGQF